MSRLDHEVVVIGGGVVGAAVTRALVQRGITTALLEAEHELALGASGTNSGILHTGFDSEPGTLETELILRSASLRERALQRLGVSAVRCGALLRPIDQGEVRAIAAIRQLAERNGVEVKLGDDGVLEVPDEAVIDPVAYTRGLAAAAAGGGADVRTDARVEAIEVAPDALTLRIAGGERLACAAAVNCAGLRADEVAGLIGDDSFEIYPRKGEFFVFDPSGGEPLERILLPVPSERTKGVLVFPTVDGKVIAGPTAHDQTDKDDWTVRGDAYGEVMTKATRMLPGLEGADPISSYAGLRPAGRGCNYVIGPSPVRPELINVAAIRSTGMTASLGIAEYVLSLLEAVGIELRDERELPPGSARPASEPWWQRAAHREAHV